MRMFLMSLAAFVLFASNAKADPNWDGLYGGVSLGAAFSQASTTDTNGGVTPGPFDFNGNGLMGGGVAGYNRLWGHMLFGVEGDIGYMNLDDTGTIQSSVPGHHQDLKVDAGAYGDITARVGLLVMPGTLVYAKGGVAFLDSSASQTTNNPGYVTHGSDSFTGWTVGAGVEHFVTDNVSLKLEYQHFDFGSETGDQTSVGDPPIGYVYKNDTSLMVDTVKAAIVYHF